MYGLPVDFDASIFMNRKLEQVTFTANTVHVVFDDDVAITLESTFLVQLNCTDEPIRETPPVHTSSLMTFVGQTVKEVQTSNDGTLRLGFDGGGALTCVDDSKEYESYHVRACGREIHV